MAAEEKWYFSKEQLSNSPSRKCGLDADKELSYRQQAANFIQDMGQKLQVTQLCINTAIVYMHRFYVFHSFTHFNRNAMAAAALFLAAKVEEQPRKLEHVIRIAHACLHRDQPHLDTKSEQYLEQAQDLVFNENVLLQTLGFDVAIDHPHTHVVRCSQLVRASKDLAQTSYIMASNSLHLTTMCLQYKPTFVACLCIYLACKWAGLEIPQSNEGKDWFWYVDKTVTLEQLEQVTSEFLTIFDKCPTKLKKKIMSITASQNASLVGQSIAPTGSPFDKEPRKVPTSLDFHSRHLPFMDSKAGPLRTITGNTDDLHKKPQQPVRHPDPSQNQRVDYREKKDKMSAGTVTRESHHTHSSTSGSHHKAHLPPAVPSSKGSTGGHHRPSSSNSVNVPRDARREQVHMRDSSKREIVPRSSDQVSFVPSTNGKQEPRVSGVETSESGTSLGNLTNTNVPCNNVSIKKDVSVSECKNDSDIKPDKIINRISHSDSSRHKLVNDQNRISVNSENRVKDTHHSDQRQSYVHRPDRQKHRDAYPSGVDALDRKLVDPSFDRHEITKKQSTMQAVSGHSLLGKREKIEENVEYKSQINQNSSHVVKRETVQEKSDDVIEPKPQINRTLTNNISNLNLPTNKIRSKSPAGIGTSLTTSSTSNLNTKKSPNSVSVSKATHLHHRSSPYSIANESGLPSFVTSVSEDKLHSSHFKPAKRSDSNEKPSVEHSRRSDLEQSNAASKAATSGSHNKIFTSTPEKQQSCNTSVRESPYQRSSKSSKQRTSPSSSKKNISTDNTPLPVSGFSSPSSLLQPPTLSTPGKSGIPTTPSSLKSNRHRTSSSGSEPELVPVATKIENIYKNIIRDEKIIIRDERNTIRDEKIKIPGRVPDIIPPIRDRKKEEFNSGSSFNKIVTPISRDIKPVEIIRPFVQQSIEQAHSEKSSSEVINIGMITVESEVISGERQSADLNTSTESMIDVISVPETSADLSLPLITISTSNSTIISESPKRSDHHHKSEKKKKKEKHKHKEKDKNRDREDREKRHKDKHKPKHKDKDKDRDKEKEHHKSEKYGDAVPSSAPIRITIPKDKLNLSQTLEVGSTSSSSSSGLKLKIQKDRLIGSDSTGNSPQMTASGSLKIKISKDAIGGFSNSHSSSSESRKRDRSPSAPTDFSPATKITKLDVPMTKTPKVEGYRSKSSHSKTNGVEYSSTSLTSATAVSSRGRSSQHYTGSSKVVQKLSDSQSKGKSTSSGSQP